jgi:hypothetical protein
MIDPPAGTGAGPSSERPHWYRLALAITFVMVLLVVTVLPIAVRSMVDVLGRGPEPLYNLLTGELVTPAQVAAAQTEVTYVNLGLVKLDMAGEQVTIAVSGDRKCAERCPALTLTFAALDDDAGLRQGLPPLATLNLSPTQVVFSEAVQLPIRGQPGMYPFDTYGLWLGIAGSAIRADGTTVVLSPETLAGRAVITLQNRIPDMVMAPPMPIDSQRAHSTTDPFAFLSVEALHIARPVYLEVLAVALVLLIAVSAALALFTRSINELALGFGGLVLGVWGVRAVLMPQQVSTITAVDLALSWVILLLLLGLAVRAMVHFHRHSNLSVPWVRRDREP